MNHAAKYRWISNERVGVPLVIRTPMGGGRGYGPTHSQSIEKLFLGIPDVQVIAPNLFLDPGELLKICVLHSKSTTLFIEHKLLYPQSLYQLDNGRLENFYVRFSDEPFPTTFCSLTEFEKPDVCILAYGGMTPKVLEVAECLLLEFEQDTTVIIPSQLHPHPSFEMLAELANAALIVTVEEGQGFGGWGAEIITAIREYFPELAARFLRVAAAATPIPAAIPLEQAALPSVEGIVDAIQRKLT